MKRNEKILSLAEEIMIDITDSRLPLHNIILKASRLSLLANQPKNIETLKQWAKWAESNAHVLSSMTINLEAARDPNLSLSSANPNELLSGVSGRTNYVERAVIRKKADECASLQANYRAEIYNFALNVHSKWSFGSMAESIFEQKRTRVEPFLLKILPDGQQRLNSIDQNILSLNPEDWKSAVGSCRSLFMDIADVLNPPQKPEDKLRYINRIKDFISPRIKGTTKLKLTQKVLEEVKDRIDLTIDLTQGGSHKERTTLEKARDVVLYTYLALAEIVEVYVKNEPQAANEASILPIAESDTPPFIPTNSIL